ncbi:hypothetical protein [Paenibacillus sp. MMS20-IR301]|uniref:hypothetical protein n=1 Tax=Paenibacillus sp. MMS20-IR301 TaxID=2895946 RepID=UPI0028E991A7|nr:hypothetical protein [Paenibacillus sp. MMS20-IR301]WNS40855.1 hypothetical protein LOS79_17535 [Paenibacillus sp. MMS20-IR301]
MNLNHSQVEHIKYGTGTVVSHAEERITVGFAGVAGEKSFLYPEAFEQYLQVKDPKLQAQIREELNVKAEQAAAEQLLREQRRLAELARLEEEKLAAKNAKSKARRKTAQVKD